MEIHWCDVTLLCVVSRVWAAAGAILWVPATWSVPWNCWGAVSSHALPCTNSSPHWVEMRHIHTRATASLLFILPLIYGQCSDVVNVTERILYSVRRAQHCPSLQWVSASLPCQSHLPVGSLDYNLTPRVQGNYTHALLPVITLQIQGHLTDILLFSPLPGPDVYAACDRCWSG